MMPILLGTIVQSAQFLDKHTVPEEMFMFLLLLNNMMILKINN
jgi:hypothetical protein